MTVYYNEFEPYPARWLRNLSAAGHIAPGVVDDRSIKEVQAEDVVGYTQVHFFAGIGGWSLALRLAGWPDDVPVWTGSCPCQPFSVAGKGRGVDDERHLWPVWRDLITECMPPAIFGEQVASPAGRDWLATVRLDLEGLGYEVGAADLCAASVGAPHMRQRLFWGARRVADSASPRLEGWASQSSDNEQGRSTVKRGGGQLSGMGNTACQFRDGERERSASGATEGAHGRPGRWRDCAWFSCRDDKTRPVEPGTSPLAHGIPDRVGKLRGYGNAIVPQVAAEFIRAFASIP